MAEFDESSDPRITRHVLRLQDLNLLEGAMATGALVALADRHLAIEESVVMKLVLENVEQLMLHDHRRAINIYTRYVELLRTEPDKGREVAFDAIRQCAEHDIEAAELIVRVGITIAKADQDFSQPEVEMIEEICQCVGITGLDALALAGSPTARAH